ncbi:zinc-dependent peptidase [Aquihabitans sp. McL0605]|uniref:M90 family metallopeptidase n=1 Tax=Aquihabitans sp. McL0605 TaxID=3415671 RepID=UPI003CF71CDB
MALWGRRSKYELPADWEATVGGSVAWWFDFTPEERARLRDLMVRLLGEKRWEAARGFDLTEEMRLVIAAQAALLVLELDFSAYRKVGNIIVHPTTIVLEGERASASAAGLATDEPMAILGQAAHEGGPIVLVWDETVRNARHPERGFNVVFHEFAHKIDMLDGVVDGTPPLATREQAQRWVEVCTKEFEDLRAGYGSDLLRDYAGVNAGEFFAVVTEVFFDRGADLRADRPDLYAVLADFYRQDPASRERATR